MFGKDELIDMYKTDFLMVKEHNFSLSEIDAMYPYERSIYIAMIVDYIERKKQAAAQNQQGF